VVGAADTFEEIDVSGYDGFRADDSRDIDSLKDGASETVSER